MGTAVVRLCSCGIVSGINTRLSNDVSPNQSSASIPPSLRGRGKRYRPSFHSLSNGSARLTTCLKSGCIRSSPGRTSLRTWLTQLARQHFARRSRQSRLWHSAELKPSSHGEGEYGTSFTLPLVRCSLSSSACLCSWNWHSVNASTRAFIHHLYSAGSA